MAADESINLADKKLDCEDFNNALDKSGSTNNIKSIVGSNNRLSKFPESVCNFVGLRSLDLMGNTLSDLPDSLASVEGLTALNLSHNQFNTIPGCFARGFNKLQELNLGYNVITSLEPSIKGLGELTTLELTRNKISELPAEFECLCKLKTLYLEYNSFTSDRSLKVLRHLKHLEKLSLSYNQLQQLSVELPSALLNLSANSNALIEFPKAVLNLEHLRMLDLSYNKIPLLPPGWKAMRLCHLKLVGNPCEERAVQTTHSYGLEPQCLSLKESGFRTEGSPVYLSDLMRENTNFKSQTFELGVLSKHLEMEVDHVRRELERTKRDLRESRREFKRADQERGSYRLQVSDCERHIADLSQEKASLQARVQLIEMKEAHDKTILKERDRLAEEVAELRAHKTRSEREIKELRSVHDELGRTLKHLGEKEAEVIQKAEQIQTLKVQLVEAKGTAESRSVLLDERSKEIALAKEDLADKNQNVRGLVKECEELRRIGDDYRNEKEVYARQIRDLRDQIQEQDKKIRLLETDESRLRLPSEIERNQKLEARIEDMTTEKKQMMAEIERLKAQSDNMDRELAVKEEQKQEMARRNGELSQGWEESKRSSEALTGELRAEIKTLRDEVAHLRSTMDSNTKDHTHVLISERERAKELQLRVTQVEEQRNQAVQDRETAKSNAQDMRRRLEEQDRAYNVRMSDFIEAKEDLQKSLTENTMLREKISDLEGKLQREQRDGELSEVVHNVGKEIEARVEKVEESGKRESQAMQAQINEVKAVATHVDVRVKNMEERKQQSKFCISRKKRRDEP